MDHCPIIGRLAHAQTFATSSSAQDLHTFTKDYDSRFGVERLFRQNGRIPLRTI
jgi:hypothetical protein